MNAVKQPFDTFVMIETAKRIMSIEWVSIQAGNVVISRRFNDEGQFEGDSICGRRVRDKGPLVAGR